MTKNACVKATIVFLAILGIIVLAFTLSARAQHTAKRPNIIFILTDDQRLEDIEHMPKLNRLLVSHGAFFTNYFDTVSLCCPSRTTILRGQYAHNTGVMTNFPPNGGFSVAHSRGLENSTVATWLHDAGYKTALIGKYLNHYPDTVDQSYVPPGWDYWASPAGGNPYSEYKYILNENGKLVDYGRDAQDYGTDVYTRKSIEFIKECSAKNEPFFLYMAVYAPHAPATVAPRHEGLFGDAKIPRTKAFNEQDVSGKPQYVQKTPPMTPEEIAAADKYYGKRLASLQAVDESIENLWKTLSELKQLDSTYIVFASDNGYHLGEHRLQRGKQTGYETDIHLPLIVCGPGVKPDEKIQALVGNIDLAPTFAELAGAKIPDFVDGRSLAPLLHGRNPDTLSWRNAYLIEHFKRNNAENRPRRRLQASAASQTICNQSAACRMQCAHLGKCFCPLTASTYDTADSAGRIPSAACKDPVAQPTSVAVSPVIEEESPELAQVPSNRDDEETQQSDAASRKARRAKKLKRAGAAESEFTAIPEFHGLRSAHETYVEYVTGEKEYYRLVDDPSQVNNLAIKPEYSKQLSTSSARLARMKKSGAAAEHELEEEHPAK